MTVEPYGAFAQAGLFLLSGVFLLAGVAKLQDRESVMGSLVAFGVPRRVVAAAAYLLPRVEVAVGAALLVPAAAWWAAAAATVLLAVFSIAIAAHLLRGHRPVCNCFGQRGSGPIGAATLCRNLALMLVATLLLWHGQPHALGTWLWIERIGMPGFLAMTALASTALLGSLVLVLWQQVGRVSNRLAVVEASAEAGRHYDARGESPLPGRRAPDVTLRDDQGQTRDLTSVLRRDVPTLLVFLSSACGPCRALLPSIRTWTERRPEVLSVIVIASDHGVRQLARDFELDLVLYDDAGDARRIFAVSGTPAAVVIRHDGTLGSSVASGGRSVAELAELVLLEGLRDRADPVPPVTFDQRPTDTPRARS
jgi:hypothetical protein